MTSSSHRRWSRKVAATPEGLEPSSGYRVQAAGMTESAVVRIPLTIALDVLVISNGSAGVDGEWSPPDGKPLGPDHIDCVDMFIGQGASLFGGHRG